jgi:hypothetical protein
VGKGVLEGSGVDGFIGKGLLGYFFHFGIWFLELEEGLFKAGVGSVAQKVFKVIGVINAGEVDGSGADGNARCEFSQIGGLF